METEKRNAPIGIRILVGWLGLSVCGFFISGAYLPQQVFSTFGPVTFDSVPRNTFVAILYARWFLTFLLTLLCGWLGDRYGRVKFILGGLILASFPVSLTGLVKSPVIFGIVSLLGGAGLGLLLPNLYALALETVTSRWFRGYALAGVAAGLLAIEAWSPLYASTLGFTSRDTQAAAYASLGISSGLSSLLLGGGLYWLISWIRSKYSWPAEWLADRQSPRWRIQLALLFIVVLSSTLLSNLLSYYLVQAQLMAGNKATQLLAVFGAFLLATLGSISFGGILSDLTHWLIMRSTDKPIGHAIFLVLGTMVTCAGLAMLVLEPAPSLQGLLPAVIVAGIGFGLYKAPLMAALAGQVRVQNWGLALGGYLVVGMLGSLLAQPISNFILKSLGYVSGASQQPASVRENLFLIPAAALVFGILGLILSVIVLRGQGRPADEDIQGQDLQQMPLQ